MMKKVITLLLSLVLAVLWLVPSFAGASEETVTLRVCNWEEYIDLGDWGEEEMIDLDGGEDEEEADGDGTEAEDEEL